jgi:hypothetical protein
LFSAAYNELDELEEVKVEVFEDVPPPTPPPPTPPRVAAADMKLVEAGEDPVMSG